ncbi:hypothetical protein HU200_000330 [Digitaria exilis]|uniref:Uncharacterized protein n=1 Tax=Digitaria exilis TaxID=1010633 RepID=A0A835G0L5_9POAL|nr:hypothetical protein HU200_000330 [Digitaria exilis]
MELKQVMLYLAVVLVFVVGLLIVLGDHCLKHRPTRGGLTRPSSTSGSVRYVVASSPDAARELMKTHDINFASRSAWAPMMKVFMLDGDVSRFLSMATLRREAMRVVGVVRVCGSLAVVVGEAMASRTLPSTVAVAAEGAAGVDSGNFPLSSPHCQGIAGIGTIPDVDEDELPGVGSYDGPGGNAVASAAAAVAQQRKEKERVEENQEEDAVVNAGTCLTPFPVDEVRSLYSDTL